MTVRHGTVKKLINDPTDAVDEMVEGFALAHADIVSPVGRRVLVRAEPAVTKVGIAVGGGSGHEPAFLGYVGRGLADSAAVGNIFAAPSPAVVVESIRNANHGQGVVLIYGNYTGDVLNCRLAVRTATAEGIDVRSVFVNDDVASAGPDDIAKRRGIAGGVLVFKAAGAAAEAGHNLSEVERLTRRAVDATRSMGVALSGAEIPGTPKPVFESGPDEMDVGLGVHGEPGIERVPLRSADEVGQLLCDRILDDLGAPAGSRLAILVNGLGATTRLEQYLVYRSARAAIVTSGHDVTRSYVGEHMTSLQMAGVSVSLMLLDEELLSLLDAPARSVGLTR